MNRLSNLNNQFESQETVQFGNYELANVKQAPADPILSLSADYKSDKDPRKVNLGIGAYRDNDGKPFVFPVVRAAEKKIAENHSLDKEYLPITGIEAFTKGAKGVLFGWDHKDVTSARVASAQTLSGTGALKIIADFFVKHRNAPIYLSNPTWGNHNQIFTSCGMDVRQYRYFDKQTKGLDF